MSQIVGRVLPKKTNNSVPASNEYLPVTVLPYDDQRNAALAVASMPLPMTQRVDDVGGGVTYIGVCNPSVADVDSPVWLISRVTVAGSETAIEHAYIPAAGSDPARYATAEHVWTDRLTLTYQ